MKRKYNLILFVLLLNILVVKGQTITNSNTQTKDSLKLKRLYKKAIIPMSLIALGALVNNSEFEKKLQTDLRNKVGNNYEFHIDDYLQHAPLVEMYTADILGVTSKNHWFDQTKYWFIARFISTTITHSLKRMTKKVRPNGELYSFPSGHTTLAFTNATVLFNEFQDTSPILAYSGYAFATTTGIFRMINNKHWLSDVMVGAGIGIIVTELVYQFQPLKKWNPFKKSKNITLIPQFKDGNYGLYFVHQF